MREELSQKLWAPNDRAVLTALIDKIVAVQLDLKPNGSQVPPETTIAAACDILQSAIHDLRDVIQRLEDLPSTGVGA